MGMALHPLNVITGPSIGQQGHPYSHVPTSGCPLYAVLMCATFVGQVWTTLAPMAYTAAGALATSFTQQSMRSLASAKIAVHLEPAEICIAHGKQTGGATVMPWHMGRILIWDVTFPNTFAPSH